MEIIQKPLGEITPYENNPRIIGEDAVNAVAESIRQFGFRVPIVIDAHGVIVCGHTRLKAAQKLKMETAPCIVADDLTEEQIKAYRLADNKTAELTAWDFSALEAELDALSGAFDMGAFGFSEDESPSLMDAMSEQYGVQGETAESDYSVVSLTFSKGDAEEVKSYIKRNGQESLTATVIEFVRGCNA